MLPAYSPDGSSIVFGCDGKVCRMNADGSDVVDLFQAPGVELNHFDWGPRENAVYPDKELGRAA